MLTLKTNDYRLTNLLESSASTFDNNSLNDVHRLEGYGRIYSKNISCALAPARINGIEIVKGMLIINNTENIETDKEILEHSYANLAQTELGIYKIYTPHVDTITEALGTELYASVDDAVQSLYNKCMEQVILREDLIVPEQTHIKIKTMKGKHGVVIITDIDDNNQASDLFLTIGLIPVLFKDWKDKFSPEEIEYFKTLVNRSQVKRISNVKAQTSFSALLYTDKYKDYLENIQRELLVTNIVRGRIDNARRTVERELDECDNIMQRYNASRALYYEALRTLNNLETTKEEAKEELKTALNMEGIKHIAFSGEDLTITVNVPLIYYDPEECECAIKHWDTDSLAYKIINTIFIEQKYKLWICSEYYFSFNSHTFRAPGSLSYSTLSNEQALFNPHTFYYNCLGDYKPQLIDAQSKQDLLMFNNIAVASAKSLNFKDGAVLNRFKDFFNELNEYNNSNILNIKCLEDEEGNRVSIKEVFFTTPEAEPEGIELEVTDL